jgi:flavorubredoxin
MLDPVEIVPNVWWVGAVDWNERNFHGYTTDRGSTYNAYLIIDDHITLIDTVKKTFFDEMIERISQVVDPKKIEYVVSNHVEQDHSSALPRFMQLVPDAKIYSSSPKGVEGLKAHYGEIGEFVPVKTGDTLDTGHHTLEFIQTPMLHWPDSMATYLQEEKLLFSMDAFGQHIATSQRFDYEVDFNEVMIQASKYYANIVMPYGIQVAKTLDALSSYDLQIICPAHGIIWKDHIADIVAKYSKWANNELEDYAIVVYDTMWHSTELMAKEILEAFIEKGIPARLFDLKYNHISDVITETLDAKYVAVGSPTLNSGMMPNVAAFLTYLKGLTPKTRHAIGIPFGSYGWGGQSIPQVAEALEAAGMELPFGQLKHQWIPNDAALNEIKQTIAKGLDELK